MASDQSATGWFRRGVMFFVGSLLAGVALVLVALAWTGKNNMPEEQLVFWELVAPPVIISTMAALASRSGATAGWYACLGGFAAVIASYAIGFMSYQGSLHEPFAELRVLLFVFVAIPGSLVGSAIGWVYGHFVARRRKLLPGE
jgi:hypothetical protein